LSEWRKQREAGSLQALGRPRGRKPGDPRDARIAALERRLERTEGALEKARRVIEVQGNVSALLGELLEPKGAPGSTER
jgi:transposase